MKLPQLLVVTDRRQLPRGRTLGGTVAECVPNGLTHVVLRELDLPSAVRAGLAEEMSTAGATVISAHQPLHGCVGVHLPSNGLPVPGSWGRSCHSLDDVARAEADGAEWVTLSPFAASVSKPRYRPPLPATAFAGHRLPVFALGGVDPGNAADVIAAGAHGIAVMGAVMRAAQPGRVVHQLLEALAS